MFNLTCSALAREKERERGEKKNVWSTAKKNWGGERERKRGNVEGAIFFSGERTVRVSEWRATQLTEHINILTTRWIFWHGFPSLELCHFGVESINRSIYLFIYAFMPSSAIPIQSNVVIGRRHLVWLHKFHKNLRQSVAVDDFQWKR